MASPSKDFPARMFGEGAPSLASFSKIDARREFHNGKEYETTRFAVSPGIFSIAGRRLKREDEQNIYAFAVFVVVQFKDMYALKVYALEWRFGGVEKGNPQVEGVFPELEQITLLPYYNMLFMFREAVCQLKLLHQLPLQAPHPVVPFPPNTPIPFLTLPSSLINLFIASSRKSTQRTSRRYDRSRVVCAANIT